MKDHQLEHSNILLDVLQERCMRITSRDRVERGKMANRGQERERGFLRGMSQKTLKNLKSHWEHLNIQYFIFTLTFKPLHFYLHELPVLII